MESLLNRKYKKKQAAAQLQQQQQSVVVESSNGPQVVTKAPEDKKEPVEKIRDSDRASTFSSQASTLQGKDQKKKIPLQHTKKGKFLDTAAAFVGLPHVCSDE